MICNIFDVVLHPSVFQSGHGTSSAAAHSEPPSPAAPGPAALPHGWARAPAASGAAAAGQCAAHWDDDGWAEIRRRLWNAKHPAGSL
ncbi:hypothetical protein H4R18_002863 [Coemansia javaensis]|uniref:Uncharacterized protein n=1 Tax=Coemansia javaensis TaxID=2761396 RepID=A0A9W8HGD0_9FUNG|nr:hypothetical protein H4R18_002863 [Coemansia javaensis]